MPTPIQGVIAALVGATTQKSYAAWPVWSDSSRNRVRFQPMPKKAAAKLWHRARDFDRQTRTPGRHGGEVGHSALQVLHALIFDFLNHQTGRLDPSYRAIAKAANVCERTVATAIQRLAKLGILHWVRRCAETWSNGQYRLEQQSNAYAVLPSTQWLGYRAPPEPPPPASWGKPPRMPDIIEQAAAAKGDARAMVSILEAAPPNGLEAALAKLGRALGAKT